MTPFAAPIDPDERKRFSDVLEEMAHGNSPHLTIREMSLGFGERGFGAMLLLLTLLALFPWPPGGKAVFSVPIILISIEMTFQMSRLWLPSWIMDAKVSRSTYRRLLNSPIALPRWARRWLYMKGGSRFARWSNRRIAVTPSRDSVLGLLRKAERLTRPRWPILTGEVADTLTGIACILLAIMMALPVPLGDMLPGIAILFLALGIVQRDGMAILIGAGFTAISAVYLVLVWKTVVAIGTGIIHWFASLF